MVLFRNTGKRGYRYKQADRLADQLTTGFFLSNASISIHNCFK